MADLSLQERLQPSLLDRLADDEPEKSQESRERRGLSMQKLRESVLRGPAWVMNAGNLPSHILSADGALRTEFRFARFGGKGECGARHSRIRTDSAADHLGFRT